MMAYMGTDSVEIMTTKDAAKIFKVYEFQTRCETDSTLSKAEQARLHELDMQEYMRTLNRVADNLIRASQPDPSDLIDLYTERTKKKKFIEVAADSLKDGDFRSLDLYTERIENRKLRK